MARACRLVVAAALGVAAGLSHADGLRFSGYATLGVTHASGNGSWGFRRDIAQAPSGDRDWRADVDSRLGLQLNWQPAAAWEAVAQGVVKRRARDSRDEENLAWGFVAWRPDAQWALRLGRTSPDLFLLADYRDVGFAYPWVRPPVEFYGWMPIWAMDGADLSRSWSSGGANWRAKLFAGRFSSTMGYGTGGDVHLDGRSLLGGTLTREGEGWTLKFSLARAESVPDSADTLHQIHQVLRSVQALPLPGIADQATALRRSFPDGPFVNLYSAVGSSWEHGPWTLQLEVAHVDGNFDGGKRAYVYASAAYRWGALTPFASFAQVHSLRPAAASPQWQEPLTPLLGPAMATQAQMVADSVVRSYNESLQEQQTWSFGARWDVTPQAALKLQWDRIDVRSTGAGLWTNPTMEARRPRVLSVSLDMVF